MTKTKSNNLINKDLLLKMTKMQFNKIPLTQLIDSDNHKPFNLLMMKSLILQDVNPKEDQLNVAHNHQISFQTLDLNNNLLVNKGHE